MIERDNAWLTDDILLDQQCLLDFYKSTGNGGQKKNKTSSAVRLIHKITKVESTSGNRRSQKENRIIALRQMKLALASKFRKPFEGFPEKFNFAMNEKNPQFALLVALILDLLVQEEFHLANCAKFAKMSTGQFIKLLHKHDYLWRKICEIRPTNFEKNEDNCK
ncbi:MAG: peptide chain release factor family protein [Lentisphaeria bacterium]